MAAGEERKPGVSGVMAGWEQHGALGAREPDCYGKVHGQRQPPCLLYSHDDSRECLSVLGLEPNPQGAEVRTGDNLGRVWAGVVGAVDRTNSWSGGRAGTGKEHADLDYGFSIGSLKKGH